MFYKSIFFAFAFLTISVGAARAQVASNPPYTLEQSVIAGGGGTSADATGNQFSITGAIGQAIADSSSASPFTVKSGFFTAAPLAPTAAVVTLGGRVVTSDGRGIRNVILTMTDASGSVRMETSSAFGYYRFSNVAAGAIYVITAKGKRFTFALPTQVLNVNDDATDINFIGIAAQDLRKFE